ncbi:hypothetical protein J7W08_07020 [Methanococcoides orientis]|uniref:hypothetical protein n=1 Tax=Methanococcoides orientis TaxID=2822137 RepID=UPI001E372A6C|nr:hypothetical protein [Methanococcoides orientis]UGV39877.1 hypothetical protein J7W08_07020 [Methanococcoides orientis]
MEKLHVFLEKLDKNEFTRKDITLLLTQMEEDSKQGIIALTKDDMQWLETYAFGLQQFEIMCSKDPSKMRAGDWRQVVHDFSKVRFFVDDMEERGLVKNVFWNVEGIVTFDIPDNFGYRNFIYCRIKSYLEKLYNLQK